MLIFVLGVLFGMLVGGGLCIRWLRREMTAEIGPKLRRMQLQLDYFESALNLAVTSRLAELGDRDRGSYLSRRGPHPPGK